jgi:pimeloyl-ACP methyl ester carboxylesterase
MCTISLYKNQRAAWLGQSATLAVAASVLWLMGAAVADELDDVLPQCEAMQVAVSLPQVPGATLYGELCVRAGASPSAVQLLVHGATYNSYYNDWPDRPGFYSYVRQMTSAGYATFNIERLGYGRSTHPNSTLSTIQNGTEALRQVVEKLRNGEIGGRAFSRVIWVGHSLGTLYGWLEASVGKDVDAFVLTGLLHTVKPSWLALAFQSAYSANKDPKFASLGFDDGYLTFIAGTRAALFYWTPGAQPDEVALDERLKDTVSLTEFGAAVPLFNSPPVQTAPSQAIKVPTLLVLGEHDRVTCDEDGLVCNEHNVAQQEGPYYSDEARLRVLVVRNTGHDLQLHRTAPATGEEILGWLSRQGLGP